MAATFTCQRPDLPGGSSNHRPLSPTISSPPLSPAPEHTSTPTSYLMTKVPSLSIVSPGVNDIDSKEVYATTLEVTDITMGAGSPPIVSIPVVDEQLSDGMGTTTTTTPSSSSKTNSRRTSKRKRTTSPPSPTTTKSPEQLHSSRRSSPHSQHSSLHSHRRSATTASITPISDRTARREDLIALHRESCRLFQDDGLSTSKPSPRASASASRPPSSSTSRTPPRPLRSASNASSPPTLRTPLSISTYQDQSNQNDSPRAPIRAATFSAYEPACTSPVQPTVTVIDWTSPSTRRREYEKIDRASSGVRGFWRRVAPRWCQFGDHRTPFFEEGKDGKGNYEGSVRRFRMDLPEECESKRGGTLPKGFKLSRKTVIHRMGGRVKTA